MSSKVNGVSQRRSAILIILRSAQTQKNEQRIHNRHMNFVGSGPVGDWLLLWYPGWKGMKWGYCSYSQWLGFSLVNWLQ